MKTLILFSLLVTNLSVGFSQNINGAWSRNLDTAVQYLTVVDNYFAVATFNLEGKKFISTRGGTALVEKGNYFFSLGKVCGYNLRSKLLSF